MNDFVDNNDDLRNIFHKEGLHRPSENFTENIIRYIEENKVISNPYKPLLSKSAWWILSGSMSIMVFICWILTSEYVSESLFTRDFFGSIRNFTSGIDFSLSFNHHTLLIITLAMASIGILLLIDLWFDSKPGRKVTE